MSWRLRVNAEPPWFHRRVYLQFGITPLSVGVGYQWEQLRRERSDNVLVEQVQQGPLWSVHARRPERGLFSLWLMIRL